MFDFLVYLAESALCLAALYLIYKVAMSNETLHRLNRVLLLGSVVLSAVLPLCRLKIIREYDPVPIAEPLGLEEFAVAEAVEVGIDYVSLLKDLAVVVFILGVAFMLVRLAVGIYSVWRLIHSGEMSVIEEDVTLTVVSQLSSPFSWFGHIVASQSDVQEYRRMILSHELAHIRLHHSWDVMAVDLALCLWWFNPAMWLLRRELQSLHEYQADDAVLRDGVDAKTYQMLLIKRAVGSRLHSVANCLNHSNLKNRITMMCKKTSSRWAATKALLVVPMVAVALSAFATTVYVPRELQDKVTENSANLQDEEKPNPLVVIDGKVVSYDEMNLLDPNTIGNMSVFKGDKAKEYAAELDLNITAEDVKEGLIVITLKKDGQTAVLDNPVKDKVIVFADEQDKGGTRTQSSTITILGNNDNTKMTAIQIDNAGEGGEMKVKVNGKDVPYETLKTIPSEEIGEMKIVKLDGVGTIYVTTKDELEAQTKEFAQKMKDFEKRIPEFEQQMKELEQNNPEFQQKIKEFKQKMKEFEQAEKQFAKADKDFKQAEKQFAQAEKAFKQMEKDVQQQNPPYIKAEKMPKFRNGDLMLFQSWMQNNVQYPAEAIEKGISGRVVFSFVVEADGSLSSYQLMASPDKILADEVERVFNSSPREWTAGEQDGKKVRVKFTLPVVFAAVADASENVSGQVVDAKGEPFVGVVVQVDGSDERGVVTDAEGRFSISMSEGETLKFSYIGMDTKRVKVDNTNKPISVTMK
ncbi:MAG: hypothetical protein E7136_06055 [Rikenellaceae bacterium]|nr:hypothetical protein [Rikenellaceae bacterium]